MKMHLHSPTTTSTKRKLFKTPNEFSLFVEKSAVKERLPCSTIIIKFCEENDVEYEKVALLVNRQLKEKLAIEFADMGMMKPQPSLEDI